MVATSIDPTSAGFLLAENRSMPMHVGGLQLFEKPEGAGRELHPRDVRADARRRGDRAAVPQAPPPLAPHRRPAGLERGRRSSTSSTTSGTARCPSPAGSASCSSSAAGCTRTRLAWERPLWETHVIEGLRDGRVAMYSKLHHALVDGVSAMRLLQSVLSTDPDERDMPAPWGAPRPAGPRAPRAERGDQPLRGPDDGAPRPRSASPPRRPACPARWSRRSTRACATRPRRSRSTPRARSSTRRSPASRRFAAQDWPIERLRAIGKATGTTLNDVVLAMCSGAMRDLPARARRPPRDAAGRDGAGRPQRQAVPRRLGRGRQRRRRGDGASSPPTTPTPPTGSRRSTPR